MGAVLGLVLARPVGIVAAVLGVAIASSDAATNGGPSLSDVAALSASGVAGLSLAYTVYRDRRDQREARRRPRRRRKAA